MSWRRGLILAGIHLAVAAPLVRWVEAGDARALQDRQDLSAETPQKVAPRKHLSVVTAPASKPETVSTDPCATETDYPAQESSARYVELPAFILTGWRMNCPTAWSLSGMLQLPGSLPPSESLLAKQGQVDLCFCVLVGLQWLLIGGFPLTRAGDIFGDPGVLITCCTVIAFGMFLIPPLSGLAAFPALIASFFWLWWASLLVRAGFRAGWRMAVAKKPQAAESAELSLP